MDFSFTEEQETIGKLARHLFERRATPERLTELRPATPATTPRSGKSWPPPTCSVPRCRRRSESSCASGGGFVELGVLLAEVGYGVAPVPAYATLVLGADSIARHGSSEQQQRVLPGVIAGSRILTAGLAEPG